MGEKLSADKSHVSQLGPTGFSILPGDGYPKLINRYYEKGEEDADWRIKESSSSF